MTTRAHTWSSQGTIFNQTPLLVQGASYASDQRNLRCSLDAIGVSFSHALLYVSIVTITSWWFQPLWKSISQATLVAGIRWFRRGRICFSDMQPLAIRWHQLGLTLCQKRFSRNMHSVEDRMRHLWIVRISDEFLTFFGLGKLFVTILEAKCFWNVPLPILMSPGCQTQIEHPPNHFLYRTGELELLF